MRQDYLADPATDRLTPVSTPAPQAIWTDLLDPTADEEAALEAELGLDLPTRDDMRGIEPSARIYSENGIQFLTANVLAGADTPDPVMEPVTFVLTRTRVVTIRYHRPYSLSNVPQRAAGMQADATRFIDLMHRQLEPGPAVLALKVLAGLPPYVVYDPGGLLVGLLHDLFLFLLDAP